MTANKVRVEVFNYTTQTWVDATTDVVEQIQIAGVGLAASPGQTSPRGNQVPAVGKCKITLKNDANSLFGSGGYNPSISGLIWPRNGLRVRASGASLGNCLQVYVTGSPDAAYVYQTVSSASVLGDSWALQWDARAQFDYQYNLDRVELAYDNEGGGSLTQYTYTNKWKTYTLTYATQQATDAVVEPRFQPRAAPGTNVSMIEYRNITLKKNGGANVLTNGNFASGLVTPWAASNPGTVSNWILDDATFGLLDYTTRLQYVGGSTITLAVVPDTWIIFNGVIDIPEPAMHQRAGPLTADVTALDFTTFLANRSLNQPPQINQTADQIMTLLFNQFPAGKMVGKSFDTGLQTFAYAFDGYTYGGAKGTKVWDAARDAAMSEYGRCWIDRDGTLRFGNRQQLVNAVKKTVALTLSDGQPWVGHTWTQGQMTNNEVIITITPRLIGSPTQLATLTTPVLIPPTPVATVGTPVTVSFVDVTGKAIGGAYVSPPVFTINTKADNSGTDYSVNTAAIALQSVQILSSQVIYTFQNNTNTSLYVTALIVSGSPVTTNNPIQRMVSDTASQARYDRMTFDKGLPYSNDPDFALSLANLYLSQFKDPFIEVDNITTQHEVRLNNTDILGVELFDIVKVSDVQANISNMLHTVVAVDYTLTPDATDYLASARLTLERVDQETFWLLDDAVYGLLDTTTRVFI